MFKINTHPQFTSHVEVPLGDDEPQVLTTRFQALPIEEAKVFDTRTPEGTTGLLKRVVIRFDDLVDDDGEPIAYTEALRDELLDLGWVRNALVRKYFLDLAGARLGN